MAAIPARDRAEVRRLAGAGAITALAGTRNRSFHVARAGGDIVVRLPAPGEAHVDRAVELANARAAAALGLGPEVVVGDAATGVLVTRAVAGRALGPDGAGRLGTALARLHAATTGFAGALDPAAALAGYAALLGDVESLCLAREGTALWASFESGRRHVPCHNDLVPANMLDDGARVHLIDWEYAGMNDPAWDLAYAAVEGEFDQAALGRMLAAYGADGELARRVAASRAVVLALNALWLRLKGRGAEAEQRLVRYRAMIDSGDVRRHRRGATTGAGP